MTQYACVCLIIPHFHPSLIFEGKVMRLPFEKKLLDLLINVKMASNDKHTNLLQHY